MATQKPISTISYNTEAFLREKLETWKKAHIIQAYMYICHKGEDGDKNHIHLRIEPNKKLDPMDLQEELVEYQIGQEKPLRCRPFRPSSEEDWVLYVVHDKQYLDLKYGGGEKGEKLPYEWTDIKAPEDYDVEIAYIRAKAKLEHTSQKMATRLASGENPMNLILQGENVYTVNAVMRALQSNDYRRLQEQYYSLEGRLNRLIKAVEEEGYFIEVDEQSQKITLTKAVPKDFVPCPENVELPFD